MGFDVLRLLPRVFLFLSFCSALVTKAEPDAMPVQKLPELAPFSAEFKLYYKWLRLGTGNYELSKQGGGQYRFAFDSKMRFLHLSDYRQVKTDFTLVTYRQAQAKRYEHHRQGSGDSYDELIEFVSPEIKANFAGKTSTVAFDVNTIDGLLVQLQLMLDLQGNRERLAYQVFERSGVMLREFKREGIERIKVLGKTMPCMRVSVKREQADTNTVMWFAKDWDYFPVQMIHYKKGKKQFVAKLGEKPKGLTF